MANAKQRARARADLEAGIRVMLHASKLTPAQKRRRDEHRRESTAGLQAWVAELKSASGYEFSNYQIDEHQFVIYGRAEVAGQKVSHTIMIDYLKQSVVVYQDTLMGGHVSVVRGLEELAGVLSEMFLI